MNVRTFLESLQKQKLVSKYAVTCLYGKQYPLLFCTHLIAFLQKQSIAVERFSVADRQMQDIKAQLATEGLSGAVTYWLSDFYSLSTKKQQEWLSYFQSYTGPHKVLLFCNDDAINVLSKSTECGIVPLDGIASSDLDTVRFLLSESDSKKTAFSRAVASRTDRLSLDTALLLAHYEVVLGKSTSDFFSHWFDTIVEPTSSLFLLSQYFFGKKSTLFFKQWALVSEQYAPQFWVVFWADQLWRASAYCSLMKQRQHAQAKKAQYKLPFSFINRDWSSYSLSELNKAYSFVYDIDFRLKNGCNAVALEHFYCSFFNNKLRM
jgi:hypothetical protein